MHLRSIATVIVASAMITQAKAADLPSLSAPAIFIPPAPIFSWTGPYFGAQVGYAWGEEKENIFNTLGVNSSTIGTINAGGIKGGVHAGYDWQTGPLVLGAEGDIDGSSYTGSTYGPFFHTVVFGAPGVVNGSASTAIPVQAALLERVGMTIGNALVYSTGGLAVADIRDSFSAPAFFAGGPVADTYERVRAGWTVGGGIDYAIASNWLVYAQYRYADFGNYNDILTPFTQYVHEHATENIVQVGFSYQFNLLSPPAPVIAKY